MAARAQAHRVYYTNHLQSVPAGGASVVGHQHAGRQVPTGGPGETKSSVTRD